MSTADRLIRDAYESGVRLYQGTNDSATLDRLNFVCGILQRTIRNLCDDIAQYSAEGIEIDLRGVYATVALEDDERCEAFAVAINGADVTALLSESVLDEARRLALEQQARSNERDREDAAAAAWMDRRAA